MASIITPSRGRIYVGEELKMFHLLKLGDLKADEAQWNQFRDYLESARGQELLNQIYMISMYHEEVRKGQHYQEDEETT